MGRYILLLFLNNIFILSPISIKQKNISLKIKQNVIFKKIRLVFATRFKSYYKTQEI